MGGARSARGRAFRPLSTVARPRHTGSRARRRVHAARSECVRHLCGGPRACRRIPRRGHAPARRRRPASVRRRGFGAFLRRGCLAGGFGRFRCAGCTTERLVAFFMPAGSRGETAHGFTATRRTAPEPCGTAPAGVCIRRPACEHRSLGYLGVGSCDYDVDLNQILVRRKNAVTWRLACRAPATSANWPANDRTPTRDRRAGRMPQAPRSLAAVSQLCLRARSAQDRVSTLTACAETA
jgi:hypothetical protein